MILGVIEGVTEFLPISSTGHLIIANHVLGIDSENPLVGKNGEPLWYKKKSTKHPEGEPLTVKLAADTYAVIIQVGAIAAVLLIYWKQLLSIVWGLLGRNANGLRLFRNIMFAFVPVVILGLLLHDWVDQHLFSEQAVISSLVVGSALMIWADRRQCAIAAYAVTSREPYELSASKSAAIGFSQCLALWPGTSRSMVTIVAAELAGLDAKKAAEFSFLVGLPTLAGASLYKFIKSGTAMIEVFGWTNTLIGIAVALVTGLVAVKFMVSYLTRYGLAPFAWYRAVLAIILVFFTYLN